MIKTLLLIFLISGLLQAKDTFTRQKLVPDSSLKQIEIKDEWIARDKGMHFAGSFISTGLIITSARRFTDFSDRQGRVAGVSITFGLGLGKELYDSRQPNNHFSYKDLTADIAGLIVALLVFK
jgi:putative lipoprotein